MKPTGILYISVDGILKPLAYSQVCRVLMGLAKRGFHYELLTLEHQRDLDNTAAVAEIRDRLNRSGISWTAVPRSGIGRLDTAIRNLARVASSVIGSVRNSPIRLIHARGYQAALVGLACGTALGVPYVFDARGRWIDERIAGGKWFTSPATLLPARALERVLYRRARAIVTLTEIHAGDVRSGQFGPHSGAPVEVIPTCADYAEFSVAERGSAFASEADGIDADVQRRLRGKLVLAVIGSINPSYLTRETLELAKRVLDRSADTHLLILSQQIEEFRSLAREAQLDEARFTIRSVPHTKMARWLPFVAWSVLLLNAGDAKRGSMPTKIGEFFASGVRIAHFGCNAEVSSWVDRSGSGFVLEALTDAELDRAARFICESPTSTELLLMARERTRTHFDLEAGLDRYERLLASLTS